MTNLLIIAGEESGDLHGAALINELKNIDDTLSIYGIGGDKMSLAGMNIIYHINKMAFLGFVEVLRHIPFIKKVQKDLISVIIEKNIKVAVLIDYPGFNLSLAKKLKKMNVKIIYYISPQIWAWGAGRLNKIKRIVDKMLVVFPFEEQLYKHAGVEVELVGHPLLERIDEFNFLDRDELNRKFNLDNIKDILLILPGSRQNEVKKIFPETIKAATKVADEFDLQIVVACASNIDESVFGRLSATNNYKVIKKFTYDLLKHSKLGIIKSGTSTLEAGLFNLPMVIVYKTNYLTYLIGKNIIKLDYIGLVNIVLGKKVVPELIQNGVSSETIYNECKNILSDRQVYFSIKNDLNPLKEKLGSKGASEKAAKIIYDCLK